MARIEPLVRSFRRFPVKSVFSDHLSTPSIPIPTLAVATGKGAIRNPHMQVPMVGGPLEPVERRELVCGLSWDQATRSAGGPSGVSC